MTDDSKTKPSISEQLLKNQINKAWRFLIGVGVLVGFGMAMILSPTPPEHSSVERVSVAFIKDIWGIPGGITLIIIGLLWLLYILYQQRSFQNRISIKHEGHLYTYFNKKSIPNVCVVFHGDELLGFDPSSNMVYLYPKYNKQLDDFIYKVKEKDDFSCEKNYWKSVNNVLKIYEKGKITFDAEVQTENDSITLNLSGKKSRIDNFSNYQDGLLREVKFM